MAQVQTSERVQRHRPADDTPLAPIEERPVRTQAGSLLDDPRVAGNPVARAHARAARETRATPAHDGNRIGTVLLFAVVLPSIFFLVSNPLGWVLLFWLCLGFGLLFGFGGIL
jgi:hypothetical protein